MGIKPSTQPNVDTNRYVSTCNVCREGIFKERDEYFFSQPNPLGYIHTRCATPAEAAKRAER